MQQVLTVITILLHMMHKAEIKTRCNLRVVSFTIVDCQNLHYNQWLSLFVVRKQRKDLQDSKHANAYIK